MILRRNKYLAKSSLVSLLNSNIPYLFIIYTLFMLIRIASFAEVYVIEFQKRSLSHAHIILTIASDDKPICREDVDRLISAKIPGQTIDPLAYDIVTKFVVHGPCVSCLIDEKCSKLYPK